MGLCPQGASGQATGPQRLGWEQGAGRYEKGEGSGRLEDKELGCGFACPSYSKLQGERGERTSSEGSRHAKSTGEGGNERACSCEKMGKKGHACNRNGGREAGLGAPRLSSHPLPRRQIQTRVHCSHGNAPWHQRSHSLLYQSRAPRHLGPCSRHREEREEKPGQRVTFQNIL